MDIVVERMFEQLVLRHHGCSYAVYKEKNTEYENIKIVGLNDVFNVYPPFILVLNRITRPTDFPKNGIGATLAELARLFYGIDPTSY